MALASDRVLITGIDSFTGRHLTAHLSACGYSVYGTTLGAGDGHRSYTCDLADAQSCAQVIETVKPNYVIHLAGISFVGHANTAAFYQINTIGTENLLNAIVQFASDIRKVLLASSATVYGNQTVDVLFEDLSPRPTNHYGMSKLSMEFVAANYFAQLPIIITRPFNYTGVGQPAHFLVPKIVTHFKERKAVIELGNLQVAREFNDVDFACDVYAKLLSCSQDGLVTNLCSGQAINLMTIVEQMNQIAGYDIDVQVNPAFVRANEIPYLVGSPACLESLIGKIPSMDIADTLRRMYQS